MVEVEGVVIFAAQSDPPRNETVTVAVPVTAVKMQTRCNVSCQLAEGRRQNHTPSITFHRGPGSAEEEKTPPWTRKKKACSEPPPRSGRDSGTAARAARRKKKGSISGAARRRFDMSKRTSRPFFSLCPLPAVIVPYFPLSLFFCEFVSLVESDAISISHFPHVPSLSPESSLGVI